MEPATRLLRYFLAVAEELNFTRAAHKLHIAQPSLSAQIRRLETELGVPLLRRSTRAVALTEAGQVLVERGPAALAELERAWDAARRAGRGETGTLRIAYTLSAGHDTAPQLVQALHETYPSIIVSTEVLPTPKVLLAVRAGRADAGIARAPGPTEGTRLRPLRRDPLGVLVAVDHPLAGRTTVDLNEVAACPVVLHPRTANPSHYDLIVELFAARGLHPRLVERDIAFDLSQRFVIDGAAITLVGQSSVPRAPGAMRWIPLAGSVAVTVALVLPAGESTATAKRFEQMAQAHAAAQHWLDRPTIELGSPTR